MTTSRRNFLLTSGTGILAGMLNNSSSLLNASNAATPRIRRDITSAEAADDIASYKIAVKKMRDLSATNPGDPIGWLAQAHIHGTRAGFNKCQHGSWFFTPWHRSYLYYFEQIVASLSGNSNFALPYWDWSRTNRIPDAFWGVGNPLLDTTRTRVQNSQITSSDLTEFVGVDKVNSILDNADFSSFGGDASGVGALEVTPHNFIHRWVGGDMRQGDSPLDPLFWCHHCNVDRLYSEWLLRDGHSAPNDNAWRTRAFNDFFTPAGMPTGGTLTAESTLDTRNLGYVYSGQRDLMLAAAEPNATWQLAGSMLAGRLRNNEVSMFATEHVNDPDFIGQINKAISGSRKQVVRLRLKNVPTPKNQDVSIRVFVNCESPSASTPISDPSYVGSIAFFGGDGGNNHDHSGNVVLNATSAFRKLYGDIRIPPNEQVKVTLITVPLSGVDSSPKSVEQISSESVVLDVVTLKT